MYMTVTIIEMNHKKLGKRYYGYETPYCKDIKKAMFFTMREDEQYVLDLVKKYRAKGVDARIIEMEVVYGAIKKDHTLEYEQYHLI